MKTKYFMILITILAFGCDYESVLIIENNKTEPIQIKTEGSPILEHNELRLLNEDDNKYEYELKKQSFHTIIQLVNEHISPSNIPFDYLEIITSTDTIIFNDQNEIFENMTTISDDYYKIIIE